MVIMTKHWHMNMVHMTKRAPPAWSMALASSASLATVHASRNPWMMVMGCTFWLISCSAVTQGRNNIPHFFAQRKHFLADERVESWVGFQ